MSGARTPKPAATPIRLIRINRALAESLENGPEHFKACYSGQLGQVTDLVREVVGTTLANVPDGGSEARWGGYLAIDEGAGSVVGTCAFKTPPSVDGTVEIAYFTFPSFEGRGYATAMARNLIDMAHGSPDVKRIIARTLPETNASTMVLKKVGMRLAGEVTDPEDGKVWEWEMGS